MYQVKLSTAISVSAHERYAPTRDRRSYSGAAPTDDDHRAPLSILRVFAMLLPAHAVGACRDREIGVEDSGTYGWRTVRDRYAWKYDTREKMGVLSFSDVKITALSADAALVVGRWRLERKTDKPHGRFSLIFRRTAAGWRIVHDHTSAAEP